MTTAAPAERTRADAPLAPPVAAELERALDRAARVDARALVRIALPAPLASPAALVRAGDDAVVWEARDGGTAWAGVGAAATVVARGPDRFAEIAARAAAVTTHVEALGDAPAPRWFGGFAFAPGSADPPTWAGFGDASFTLPRWTYLRDGDAAQLVLTLAPGARADRAALHAELAQVLAALAAPIGPALAAVVAQHDLPTARWLAEIERIRAAITTGELRKVVAARARVVELARAIDAAAVVAELGRRQPACTRFAIGRAGAAFVGASPERLIRKRGRAIDSEALAGSCARAGDDAAAAAGLLASAKDRGEHAWVVEAIEAALAPRCRALTVPAEPAVRTLRQILHLHTPIVGELDRDRHVLELVAALHPTPAVGGTPTADALAWIAAHEPSARGWYAAPVGWFDGAGDGEFAVAIRSGLLAGTTATLFAGAGIVAASDPDAELAETELKLRALSGALGLEDGR
ncbi:MAG: isochorismate synthase [Myxococcales bacterium]|nr:isochorismate synthase [Myxococcales bacterium]